MIGKGEQMLVIRLSSNSSNPGERCVCRVWLQGDRAGTEEAGSRRGPTGNRGTNRFEYSMSLMLRFVR